MVEYTEFETIRNLCEEKTDLTPEEIDKIARVAEQLQITADLDEADVFIDCQIKNRTDQAVVVAQAKSKAGRSLYSSWITGQMILRDNEPGVFYSLATGEYITGTRAITNEKVTIKQKISPIKTGDNRVIGVVILEQDISTQIIQERNVRLFQQTARDLGETLWEIAVAETNLPSLIHEGVFMYNSEYLFTYINPTARQWFEKLEEPSPQIGTSVLSVFSGVLGELLLRAFKNGVEAQEFTFGENTVLIKAISIRKNNEFKGGLILLSDISELRQKEKQLMIKSAVIKEIHHRVKNNLQTIGSLLRLQMRRTQSSEIRKAFNDSIHRIRTIALVHETLSHGGIDVVELIGMIERIVSMLVQTGTSHEQRIGFSVKGESISLTSEKATAVALILNELVQNCLDHAFEGMAEGEIFINVAKTTVGLIISVRDNGPGFDFSKIPEGKLGTRIVRTLIQEDLGGELWYRIDHGTEVKFSVMLTDL